MISKDVQKAVGFLNRGEVVAIPTETVYGLAGNIFDKKAIDSIYAIKKRPRNNPLIVHINNVEKLSSVASEIPDIAHKLAAHFWPGPLTLLLKKQVNIPDYITAGKPTVAVRVPDHPIAIQLLADLDFPLAAPSANPFGRISPTTAEQVDSYFSNEIKMVLDGGRCKKGLESTIVGFEGEDVIVYRLGSISREDIERVIGKKTLLVNKEENSPKAPGMLLKHYAPKTKMYLVDNVNIAIQAIDMERVGLLLFKDPIENPKIAHKIVLSSAGDLEEAAYQLYEAMQTLDKMNLDCIIAERFPAFGIGNTINDKLERASVQ